MKRVVSCILCLAVLLLLAVGCKPQAPLDAPIDLGFACEYRVGKEAAKTIYGVDALKLFSQLKTHWDTNNEQPNILPTSGAACIRLVFQDGVLAEENAASLDVSVAAGTYYGGYDIYEDDVIAYRSDRAVSYLPTKKLPDGAYARLLEWLNDPTTGENPEEPKFLRLTCRYSLSEADDRVPLERDNLETWLTDLEAYWEEVKDEATAVPEGDPILLHFTWYPSEDAPLDPNERGDSPVYSSRMRYRIFYIFPNNVMGYHSSAVIASGDANTEGSTAQRSTAEYLEAQYRKLPKDAYTRVKHAAAFVGTNDTTNT